MKRKRPSLQTLKKENIFFIDWINAINALNNIYYITNITIEELQNVRNKLINDKSFNMQIEIPNENGVKIIKEKRKAIITDVIKKNIRTDLIANSIVSAVSISEKYIESVLKKILIKFPQKLTTTISKTGTKESDSKTIPLSLVTRANSLEDIYNELINEKIHQLMYAKPKEYFDYFEKISSIKIQKNISETFFEIKATRDLIIHNNSYVNDLYIEKSESKCRTKNLKQKIPLNKDYFIESIGMMKKLINEIYENCSKSILKKTKKSELYPIFTKK